MGKRKKEEETMENVGFKALLAAEEAFNHYLEESGNDSSFWVIRFTMWVLGTDFGPLAKIEIDRRSEVKGDYIEP